MKKRLALLVLVPLLTFAACGDDDGGSVTDIEGSGGSSSSSGSGSGSGSGSASGSASASGASAESTGCEVEGGTEAEADQSVPVLLNEYAITLSTNPLPSGIVEFEAENQGEEDHEIVVIKGVDPEDVEVGDDGVDEDALPEGAEVLGEIEGFPGGKTCAGSFELEPGNYTLLCNIVDEEHGHVHAAEGMLTGMLITE